MKQRVLRSARSSSCSHEWSSLLPGSTHSHTLYRNSNKGSGWSADYWGNTNPVSRGCRMNQTHHLLEVKHDSFQLSFCTILWNRGDARAHGDENRHGAEPKAEVRCKAERRAEEMCFCVKDSCRVGAKRKQFHSEASPLALMGSLFLDGFPGFKIVVKCSWRTRGQKWCHKDHHSFPLLYLLWSHFW